MKPVIRTKHDFAKVVDHYLICLLWASTDDDGEPLDDSYTTSDIEPESRESASRELASFLRSCTRAGIDLSPWTPEQLGHDIFLTRNYHGTGFWDRGHQDGERASAIAHAMGATDPVVTCHGTIDF